MITSSHEASSDSRNQRMINASSDKRGSSLLSNYSYSPIDAATPNVWAARRRAHPHPPLLRGPVLLHRHAISFLVPIPNLGP
jgi:hypothetical protein